MLYYFTSAGEPYTSFANTGDEAVAQGLAIKSDVPEGIECWRLSLNTETNEVIVAYEGMSEEDAVAQQLSDAQAAFEAEAEKGRLAREALEASTA